LKNHSLKKVFFRLGRLGIMCIQMNLKNTGKMQH